MNIDRDCGDAGVFFPWNEIVKGYDDRNGDNEEKV